MTRLKWTCDLINVNMENDRFWSILINANFESRSKIFDLFKKLQTLLLESIKIDERIIQYVMIITFDCNLHLTLVWIGVVDAFLGLKEFVSFCKLLRQTDKDPFETLNINFSRKSTTESLSTWFESLAFGDNEKHWWSDIKQNIQFSKTNVYVMRRWWIRCNVYKDTYSNNMVFQTDKTDSVRILNLPWGRCHNFAPPLA